MSEHPSILSVNVGKRHASHESILQTSSADILLIQEPAWFNLVPSRSDYNPDGTPSWGTCRNDMWEVYLPPRLTKCPEVATFIRKSLISSLHPTTLLHVATYSLLPITISFPLFSL